MAKILITAFEPYGPWKANASWLALVELTRQLPAQHSVTTRLYPVDVAVVQRKLEEDLAAQFDLALHLGQAPGSTHVQFEAIGINVARHPDAPTAAGRPLVTDGPIAFGSQLPLETWTQRLCERGIPARVSYHAGTYLCNAILYSSHYAIRRNGWKTKAGFIHLPVEISQAASHPTPLPSLSKETAATALKLVLEQVDSVV
ncbi:MAG: pyrrolidone-carboxylate peptidase [Planctomycetaceae bacterium]|nr:pyrrolidone-carboxylate peptidase [Planctomycetaceae bacterium]